MKDRLGFELETRCCVGSFDFGGGSEEKIDPLVESLDLGGGREEKREALGCGGGLEKRDLGGGREENNEEGLIGAVRGEDEVVVPNSSELGFSSPSSSEEA